LASGHFVAFWVEAPLRRAEGLAPKQSSADAPGEKLGRGQAIERLKDAFS
jgi:hypothetical protein